MGNCLSKELACEKCKDYRRRIEEYERRLEEALADREKALGVIEKLHLEYVNSIARCAVDRLAAQQEQNVRRDGDSSPSRP